MLGEKDAATQQYEREIRLGMILLGILCVAFVGVLARRIWVENRQQVAANKKPVYLTKAQRDDLRVKNKPRSLATLNTSTPMRRMRSAKDVEAKSENSTAGQAHDNVPDLSIGDDAPEESKSQPAHYLQHSEAEPEPEAEPIKPAPLKLAPPVHRESAKSEIDFAPAADQNASSSGDEETGLKKISPAEIAPIEEAHADELSSTRGSRFSDPQPEETKSEEPAAEEPEPAPRPAPKVNPPASPETRQPISSTPNEDPIDKSAAPLSETPEVVRKKVDKNPWKRPATSAPKQHHPHYTVQSGDTLKSIAQEILGDETRWQEIYDLNRAEIGDDYTYLRKGLRLKLPKANDTAPELADPKSSSAKIEPQSVLKK